MARCGKCGALKLTERPCPKCGAVGNANEEPQWRGTPKEERIDG